MKKSIPIEKLCISYQKHKSVWKVGEEFNITVQDVHNRLVKLGYTLKGARYTNKERKAITEAYNDSCKCGDLDLRRLSEKLNRPITGLCREAKRMGLADSKREKNAQIKEGISDRKKKWHQENEHPRGMKGKKHSEENCRKISIRTKKYWKDITSEELIERNKKILTTTWANGNDKNFRGNWKASWRKIGKIKKFYRSRWEANYARYLEFSLQQGWIKKWEHEPKTFWFEKIKRGTRSYLPDFKVTNNDNSCHWAEVKGWMDDRSVTKIKRFKKYFPKEKLILIQKQWFKENNGKMKMIIRDWE